MYWNIKKLSQGKLFSKIRTKIVDIASVCTVSKIVLPTPCLDDR